MLKKCLTHTTEKLLKPHYLILTAHLAISLSLSAHASGGLLRIICDGEANGAVVYVNGKMKGECPLEMKAAAGKLNLRVQKTVNGDTKLFEQSMYMGDGVLKKVEVQLASQAERVRAEQKKTCPSCIDMVQIKSGSFMMGTDSGEDDEKPAHRVTINYSFEIGKTEVTQGQWREIMGTNPSKFDECGDTCPVEMVSWNDIQEYIAQLNQKTGKNYRLPTDAEWEYACYGGSQTDYCGGNNINSVAWFKENGNDQPHPVGQKKANFYGLYDMSGNVWEWVQDSYHKSYYGAPSNGDAWAGDGAKRVLRGGSWGEKPKSVRATARFGFKSDSRYKFLGFRIARSLP